MVFGNLCVGRKLLEFISQLWIRGKFNFRYLYIIFRNGMQGLPDLFTCKYILTKIPILFQSWFFGCFEQFFFQNVLWFPSTAHCVMEFFGSAIDITHLIWPKNQNFNVIDFFAIQLCHFVSGFNRCLALNDGVEIFPQFKDIL